MWRRFKKIMTTPIGRGGAADRVFNAIIMVIGPLFVAGELYEFAQYGLRYTSVCDDLSVIVLGPWSLVLWISLIDRIIVQWTRPKSFDWPPALCPRCRYDLRGSTSVACPECGYYLGTTKRKR